MKRLNGKKFRINFGWILSVQCACADEYAQAHAHTNTSTRSRRPNGTASSVSPHHELCLFLQHKKSLTVILFVCVYAMLRTFIIHTGEYHSWKSSRWPFFSVFIRDFAQFSKILEFGKCRATHTTASRTASRLARRGRFMWFSCFHPPFLQLNFANSFINAYTIARARIYNHTHLFFFT